jgi:hypothetical protein
LWHFFISVVPVGSARIIGGILIPNDILVVAGVLAVGGRW